MPYKLWNKTDNLYPPGGGKLTPAQAFAAWPWAENPAAKVIITDGDINCGVFMSLTATRAVYEQQGMVVPDGATDEEIVQAIWDWEHRVIEAEPSDEVLSAAISQIMGD
jgi:hypothetical protein